MIWKRTVASQMSNAKFERIAVSISTQDKNGIEHIFRANSQNRIFAGYQAVFDDDYLQQASANVLRWEESDKQMAQGRTNFQLEKFIGLNTHNISVSFEHILKERRIMATGYMHKLIEMKERAWKIV